MQSILNEPKGYTNRMSKLHNFLSASMRTQYTVDVPDEESIILHLGIQNPDLDRLLHQNHAKTYAYITAYNPNSSSLSKKENQQRHQQLCQELDQREFNYLLGKNIPDTDEWEPETCLLIFNISRPKVQKICQSFEQDAAVIGELGFAPKIFFTNQNLQEEFRTLMNSCVVD